MRYGHFDDRNREYVIENPDTPMSWVNYLGTGDYCGIGRIFLDPSPPRIYNVITIRDGGAKGEQHGEETDHQDRELARHPHSKGLA
jgi:hypothetical protein